LRGYLNRYAGNDGGGGKNTILGGRPLDPQFEGAEDYLDAEALMIGEFLKSIGLSKLDASQETSSIDRRIKRIQRQAEQRGAQNRRGTQTRGRK
jgi:hypothetical protein